MPKFLIYPEGCDPMVASGPPGKTVISLGITWTEEETVEARKLESQAKIVEREDRRFLPVGLWSREVE